MSRIYALYASTIFVGSFLLFQVQPLLGKHLLPWFGGSPAVWITALFFFMGGLAVGYLYALLLTLLPRLWQVLGHAVVVVVVGLVLYQNSLQWPSAITPAVADVTLAGDPAWAIFMILAVSIGLPFVLLSSTSSLLQYWYGRTTGAEPFSLYAISNTGSLLGLLSYPLLFERFLTTDAQGWWWSAGFILFGVLLISVLLHYLQAYSQGSVVTTLSTRPSTLRFLGWLLLASVPIMTMVTGTDYLTGFVVAVPFLWVLPLALYLLSFVVSFRGTGHLPRPYLYVVTLLATLLGLGMTTSQALLPVVPTVLLILLAMFAVNHLCHEWLYALRPDKEHLTAFYVALALGGIFASSVVLIMNLYVVPLPVEFLYLLAGAGVTAASLLLYTHRSFLRQFHAIATPVVVFSLLAIIFAVAATTVRHTNNVIALERNFFGFKAVREVPMPDGSIQRTLVHGTTNHGYQFIGSELEHKPVGYYSDTSGVAAGFAFLRAQNPSGLRVAVAGLGAGALAARCGEGDTFSFYEIDPQVIDLALQYFTYLQECSQHEIILADARLALAERASKSVVPLYDFIILDAYADDVMPIHLMTTEAVQEYLSLLSPEGLLAIHISSRYLDLLPVIHALAVDNDLVGVHREDREFGEFDVPSHWTLLARSDVFTDEAFTIMQPLSEDQLRLWTDRYSTLLPLIRW